MGKKVITFHASAFQFVSLNFHCGYNFLNSKVPCRDIIKFNYKNCNDFTNIKTDYNIKFDVNFLLRSYLPFCN